MISWSRERKTLNDATGIYQVHWGEGLEECAPTFFGLKGTKGSWLTLTENGEPWNLNTLHFGGGYNHPFIILWRSVIGSLGRRNLLGQWLNFKLFGITYLVGKIKFELFFQGPLAEWGKRLHSWLFFFHCHVKPLQFSSKTPWKMVLGSDKPGPFRFWVTCNFSRENSLWNFSIVGW